MSLDINCTLYLPSKMEALNFGVFYPSPKQALIVSVFMQFTRKALYVYHIVIAMGSKANH